MKKRCIGIALGLFLVFTLAFTIGGGVCLAGDSHTRKALPNTATNSNTVMHPDRETLLKWIGDYEKAPKAYMDEAVKASIPLKGSYSLLGHLNYIPSARNQGSCGNCWVWAGTGIMEVALDVDEGMSDRLSIQYLNSCKTTGSYACCGGNLDAFVDFYTAEGHAIPWSNTNAEFQDAGRKCSSGSSAVSCASIAAAPDYPVLSITDTTITTHGIGQAAAIANIKNVLNQGKAVSFAYYLANSSDWNNFHSFWNSEGEDVVWNPDFSCGHTWVEGEGGGHAVLCVGYNDDDPNNRYWIIVNSWGTASGGRPNAIFRLDMDMNYDCTFHYYEWCRSFLWQTLDIEYGSFDLPDLVVTGIETDPAEPEPGETVTVSVTVKNQGVVDAGLFYLDWYADRTSPPAPGDYGDQYEKIDSLAAGASYTMNISWVYVSAESYDMYAWADTGFNVPEEEEGNNIFGPQNIMVGVCECDLNHDGLCDMFDWFLFGADWGRTDCPIPFTINSARNVPSNSNISGNPEGKKAEGELSFSVRKVENALPDGDKILSVPSITGRKNKVKPVPDTQRGLSAAVVAGPAVWSRLESMSFADKENASLHLEAVYDPGTPIMGEIKKVESLWNSGNFDEAVSALKRIESDGLHVAAGIGWKTPKAVDGLKWFEGDVRIGIREHLGEACLDFHAGTGNLFAILHRKSPDNPFWSVNISTNGGRTWEETYYWLLGSGDLIVDLSASVVSGYLYVGYVGEGDGVGDSGTARIRRFSALDGGTDTGYSYKIVFDKGNPIKEISLCSNADAFDNRIYYLAILDSGDFIWYWANQDGVIPWTEVSTGVNFALRGLDSVFNEGFDEGSDYHLFVSFVSSNSGYPVYVWRYSDSAGAEAVEVEPNPGQGTDTGISAYYDRIITVYEYRDDDNNQGIKYRISYEGGENWLYWYIAEAEEGRYFCSPNVSARKGGGITAVFQEEAGEPDICWHSRRNYSGGSSWSVPEQFNDIDVYTGSPMVVEAVPPFPGNAYSHGSIWLSREPGGDGLKAYFDRSDGGESCECDLNHDGVCDMFDWFLFGADWGRTDCPRPH